ncbi:isopenicillin N synthase family dioxygenase [Kiloniella laminariae]|uniref:isopenicillin N synthase family dioxygenase n=1 Tax=Kiloniella laminariae TaxID=454162 RepID=UPI0003794162|nr:2-oxoglutarate and iron-dependent oxygenase domain-containing protein [Kiloniella laminariae]
MGSLPVIDIAPLAGDDPRAFRRAADQLGRAAREVGFFYITNHGVSPDLIARAYGAAEEFFALPDEIKWRYYIGKSANHRGYVPFTDKGAYDDEDHRSYEAFDLAFELPRDDPDYLAGNLLLGPNVWPESTYFRETISTYYQAISGVGFRLCSALELHLGLARGEMTSLMRKPIAQLRLLHYLHSRSSFVKKSVNMGAHTDYECLTLLHQRQKGLQILDSGNSWTDVPVMPENYIVNIGDIMEAWSNGAFRATPHRVLNLAPERFSMPYFVAPDYHTLVKPFERLISPENPPKYESFLAGMHLERMLRRDFSYLRERKKDSLFPLPGSDLADFRNPFENRITALKS